MLLTISFLSYPLEVTLIFISWSFPTQVSIYFHPRLTLGFQIGLYPIVPDTLGNIIFYTFNQKSIGSIPMRYNTEFFLIIQLSRYFLCILLCIHQFFLNFLCCEIYILIIYMAFLILLF